MSNKEIFKFIYEWIDNNKFDVEKKVYYNTAFDSYPSYPSVVREKDLLIFLKKLESNE